MSENGKVVNMRAWVMARLLEPTMLVNMAIQQRVSQEMSGLPAGTLVSVIGCDDCGCDDCEDDD